MQRFKMSCYATVRTLFYSNTLLQNAFKTTTANNITRHMANRDKLYGVEEGHATQKNEVRKEKYWRKRNPATKGFLWREREGYDKTDALCRGAFSLIPDWSEVSGEPGAPTEFQERVMQQRLRLITEIYEAAQLVKKAQEFESSKQEATDGVKSEP